MKSVLTFLLLIGFIGIGGAGLYNGATWLSGSGKASFYGDKFHGKKTASGETYDMHDMTAAHKTLPFGTKVKITNANNGKSVVVEITDRGPFTKGREIDLSRKAFFLISGGSGSGSITATLEVLQE